MRWLELFAGLGGAARGIEAAGGRHLALCEWDRDACETMRRAGLGPVVEGDVRDLARIEAAIGGQRVDALWSSFPCQPFSAAGPRTGARDERNGWPWTVDAIDRFRPRWVVCENVGGLAHHRGGCDRMAAGQVMLGGVAPPDPTRCAGCYLERVILPDLRRRYPVAGVWALDAADFGVPQNRHRLIIWAGLRAPTMPAPTHAEPGPDGTVPRGLLPWVTMRQALGVLVRGVETAHGPGETTAERETVDLSDRPAKTIPAARMGHNAGGSMFVVCDVLDRPSTTIATGHGEPLPNAKRRRKVEAALGQSAGSPLVVDGQVVYPVGLGRAGSEPERLDRPADTVTGQEVRGTRASAASGYTFSGGPDRASDGAFLATGRRRLTVRECLNLQGLPEELAVAGGSDSAYRQVGNAVPPALAAVVAGAVMVADGGDDV